MKKSFFIMLPNKLRLPLKGSSLEEVSQVYSSWSKYTQQEMSEGQLYMEDENGKLIATEFIKSPEKEKEIAEEKVTTEFIRIPEKENEIVLPSKLKKILINLINIMLPLGTLYLLGFWAVATLVFFFSLPWLYRKIEENYNSSSHHQETSITATWLGIVGVEMIIACIIGFNEGPIHLPLGKEVILIERDTVEHLPRQRVSCDSISFATQGVKFQDSLMISKRIHITGTWMFGYTKRDTIRYTYKISRKDLSYINMASPLENFCGDTIVSKKYKPYEDRNFSLIKVNKKYYDANYKLVDTTYYQNLSPKIGVWELEDIFKGTKAEWKHSIRVTKYTLAMLDGDKVDTLYTKEDAQSLLEAKCKDRATVEQRLIYAELDACLKNNKIQRIHVQEERGCGSNSVRLSYARGSVSSYPYRCNESAGWTYSQYATATLKDLY
jgi:hypothetical protein